MDRFEMMILMAIGMILIVLFVLRLRMSYQSVGKNKKTEPGVFSQTTGNKEIQADQVQIYQNSAGVMAVLADGIGKENTGKVAAQVAVDALLDAFEPYRVLNNPEYLFRTAFLEAHSRVQATIGERRGGVSMGAVYSNGKEFHYALAGNIKIALLRNGELIPVSKGQTLNVLAKTAYKEGKLPKKETIWSQETTRMWNYLGKDGFYEIEVCRPPILLKSNDLVVMTSQGIYEEVSWSDIEEVLLSGRSLKQKAEAIISLAENKDSQDKDNGSIVLLAPEVINETNQF